MKSLTPQLYWRKTYIESLTIQIHTFDDKNAQTCCLLQWVITYYMIFHMIFHKIFPQIFPTDISHRYSPYFSRDLPVLGTDTTRPQRSPQARSRALGVGPFGIHKLRHDATSCRQALRHLGHAEDQDVDVSCTKGWDLPGKHTKN